MDFFAVFGFVIMFAIVMIVWRGIKIVPQQEAWIVEYLGKFDKKLEPGLNLINPFFARVAYKHTLKEMAVDVPEQAAITRDNVTLHKGIFYHHVGIYAYRRVALEKFVSMSPSENEQREKLEQLRALDAGMAIGISIIDSAPIGVDTPETLEQARDYFRKAKV